VWIERVDEAVAAALSPESVAIAAN